MNIAQKLARIRHVLFLIFLSSIAISLLTYSITGKEISIQDIHHYTSHLGLWLPISFIVIYTGICIFIPTTPLMALAGILFGLKNGSIYTIIAGLASSIIVFYISRFLGRDFVDKILDKKFLSKAKEYDNKLSKNGLFTVFILRNIPIMPFNILSIIMGISKIKFRDYLLGTFIGLIPTTLITVYFGEIIFHFITNKYIASCSGLLIVGFIIYLLYKRK